MIRAKGLSVGALLALACLTGAVPAAGQSKTSSTSVADAVDINLRAYSELLRSDLRGQKSALIAQVMQFSEAEDTKFWPVYRDYEAGLAKLNDERIALIKEYAAAYEKLTDADADRLARAALDLEARRQTLKGTYYDRLKSALSA